MLSNKWYFTFDAEEKRISMAITLWSIEKENTLNVFFANFSQKKLDLMFEMIETAYLLSLIEVKD